MTAERGSAPLEALFAIVLLMILALGTVQVALALYGRNVIAATAHEAARSALERGATAAEAEALATSNLRAAAGGLIDGLAIAVRTSEEGPVRTVTVRITGRVEVLGPLPIPVPVDARATATTEAEIG